MKEAEFKAWMEAEGYSRGILGGLTFLPGLALGPVADHLAMIRGQLF